MGDVSVAVQHSLRSRYLFPRGNGRAFRAAAALRSGAETPAGFAHIRLGSWSQLPNLFSQAGAGSLSQTAG